ncbi:hypothetical protein F5X68DRAFT_203176 [Plectosphaerella plurivora]|uniref:Uncharacterized protein n=1 Tax=Plectosphaerella plurivora TaxID=936078 RepID=A0A9P9AAE0_9PEZI|nr:hypothetical protein F5X68DRAFT_203176 [Plectosphaerella plurivora]
MDAQQYQTTTTTTATATTATMTPFYRLWEQEHQSIRDRILDLLPREDVASLRLASSACCNMTTKRLFKRITITFSPSTFTKPSRVQALARIGHHVEHLTFHMAHSQSTFLPPLIHPLTGAEICFLYTPHTSMASVLARPKYANTELGEILTQQYPPVFHAATNVPSFINALKHLVALRHLTVRTPGQDPRERYRRDSVDYALISLRIALERAPLRSLDHLSLSHLHPSALHYFRYSPGGSFGALPSSQRRWRQIRKLSLSVESWDFADPTSPGRDHLKIIDDYLRSLAPGLETLSFSWLGLRGPCPLALSADPLFAPPRASKKLFNEVTSPMSPLPPAPARQPIHFPCLRRMSVSNASMSAAQLAGLVDAHRATARDFDFQDLVIVGGGSLDDALAPLMDQTSSGGTRLWSQHSRVRSSSETSGSAPGSLHSVPSLDELPSTPSAAAAAASRELLDFDLGSELGSEPSHHLFGEVSGPEFPLEILQQDMYDNQSQAAHELEDDLASEIAAAREVGTAVTTRLKKRRRRPSEDEAKREDKQKTRGSSGSSSKREKSKSRSRSHSNSSSTSSKHKEHDLQKKPSAMSVGSLSSSKGRRPSIPVPPMPCISPPIMDTSPPPVLLQPAVYNPSHRASGGRAADHGISSVQRDIEKEEAHRVMAEDSVARTSALRKAKEAVLSKLSEQFMKKQQPRDNNGHHGPLTGADSCAMAMRLREGLFGKSFVSVLPDDRAMSSQSVLVPLMFTRS